MCTALRLISFTGSAPGLFLGKARLWLLLWACQLAAYNLFKIIKMNELRSVGSTLKMPLFIQWYHFRNVGLLFWHLSFLTFNHFKQQCYPGIMLFNPSQYRMITPMENHISVCLILSLTHSAVELPQCISTFRHKHWETTARHQSGKRDSIS